MRCPLFGSPLIAVAVVLGVLSWLIVFAVAGVVLGQQ